MLILDKIHLKIHDQLLLENEHIEIHKGYIHVIMGESGTGKTSLLYEISLLASLSGAIYQWDNQRIDMLSESEKTEIRRSRIGYILQDLELISEDLSLRDNMKCMFALKGKEYNEDIVYEYLNKLHLKCSLEQSVESMSRGERQRLALVLALIKDVDLIICDEPTSALDIENAHELMRCLRLIANEYHKMIVIATHDDLVANHADILYKIEKQELICKKQVEIIKHEEEILKNIPVHKSFYLTYKKRRQKKLQILFKGLYVFTIVLLCIVPVILNMLLEKEQELYQLYMNNEIIVMNSTERLPYGTYNAYTEFWNNDQMNLLEEIEHVKGIDYYWEMNGFLSGYDGIDVLIVPKKDIEMIVISSFLDSQIDGEMKLFANVNIKQEEYDFEIPINDYQVINYPKNNYVKKEIVYIPTELMNSLLSKKNITESGTVVVYCDDVNGIETICQEIQKWFPHATISSSVQKHIEQIQMLEFMQKYISVLKIILIVGTIIVTYIIQTLENKSREKEIGNLRINGVSKNIFYKLYYYENRSLLIMTMLSCLVAYITLSLILILDINMLIMSQVFLQVVFLMVVTRMIPTFIIVQRIFKKEVSYILRNI